MSTPSSIGTKLVIWESGTTLMWSLIVMLDMQSLRVHQHHHHHHHHYYKNAFFSASRVNVIIRKWAGKFKKDTEERQYVIGSPRGGQGRGGEVQHCHHHHQSSLYNDPRGG